MGIHCICTAYAALYLLDFMHGNKFPDLVLNALRPVQCFCAVVLYL